MNGRLIKCISDNKPLRYVHGKKQILSGLEKKLKGMKAGSMSEFDLTPEEGYGMEDKKAYIEMPKKRFPKRNHFVGKEISSKDGKFLATVREVKQNTLVLNFNHPLAGKQLHYCVRVMEVKDRAHGLHKNGNHR